MITTDEYGTLVDHTYVNITVNITCTQLFPALYEYDTYKEDERIPFPLAFADQRAGVYDLQNECFLGSGELRAFKCLSDNYKIDYHGTAELEIDKPIRVQLIYIVEDRHLNTPNTLLLFTPQYGFFSSDHLKRLGYSQPHILLKGEYK